MASSQSQTKENQLVTRNGRGRLERENACEQVTGCFGFTSDWVTLPEATPIKTFQLICAEEQLRTTGGDAIVQKQEFANRSYQLN